MGCVSNSGFFHFTRVIKFTFPLDSNLIACTRCLFKSCHCALIVFGQSLTTHCANIAKRLTHVSMVKTTIKFVDRCGLFTIPVHTEIREFGQLVFSPVSSVSYSASVRLFHMYQPHQGFLAVIIITAVTSCRYQTYGLGLQKSLSQDFVTCGGDGEGLEENLDVADLDKLPSEYLTRLSQDGDVILTILFQDTSVIKNIVLLTLILRHEFPSLRLTHLVRSEICDIREGSYIVQICLGIEKMWIP